MDRCCEVKWWVLLNGWCGQAGMVRGGVMWVYVEGGDCGYGRGAEPEKMLRAS